MRPIHLKVIITVHGIVQGVGYRDYVRRVARRYGVTGSVRNVSDGSVEIYATGEEPQLRDFEKGISVSMRYGPQVFKVETVPHFGKPDEAYPDGDFIIRDDKVL
jgi:acylphosphatase